MGPFGWGCWPGPQHPGACIGKTSVPHAGPPPNAEKQRGLHSRVPDGKGINSVCGYGTHTHTHTAPANQLGRVCFSRCLALSLPSSSRHIPWGIPLVPSDREGLQGRYLKGDVEGLEMTLQVIQLNEVGCFHRLAIHKGGWRRDSEREKHEFVISAQGHCFPGNPNICLCLIEILASPVSSIKCFSSGTIPSLSYKWTQPDLCFPNRHFQ